VTALYASADNKPTGFNSVVTFLANHRSLPGLFSADEHKLVKAFAENSFQSALFSTTPRSPLANLQKFGVVVHLVATLLSLNEGFSPFYALLFKPGTHKEAYLPTMPDDERQVAARMIILHYDRRSLTVTGVGFAIKDTGVYLSPRGHIYTVIPCGWPMRVQKCLCGEDLGGTSHRPVILICEFHLSSSYLGI
jgi:hypothetical protein